MSGGISIQSIVWEIIFTTESFTNRFEVSTRWLFLVSELCVWRAQDWEWQNTERVNDSNKITYVNVSITIINSTHSSIFTWWYLCTIWITLRTDWISTESLSLSDENLVERSMRLLTTKRKCSQYIRSDAESDMATVCYNCQYIETMSQVCSEHRRRFLHM